MLKYSRHDHSLPQAVPAAKKLSFLLGDTPLFLHIHKSTLIEQAFTEQIN